MAAIAARESGPARALRRDSLGPPVGVARGWRTPPSCTSPSTPSPIRNGATATKTRTSSSRPKFDADAIAGALKSAGVAGFILTCKHHDGFCLWPTKTTDHSIRSSSWRGGKGDVVGDLSDAARRHGLRFGVYLSPWDRNNADYGTPHYIDIYRRQLTELLTQYGPIFEVWHDGANGGDGYLRRRAREAHHRQAHLLRLAEHLGAGALPAARRRDLQRRGPGCPLGGQRTRHRGRPLLGDVRSRRRRRRPGLARRRARAANRPPDTRHGSHWLPAECDVSIRPGWFWHENENARVKTPAQLIDLYYKSVGRGANLLLNVPPNRDGLLQAEDVAALEGPADATCRHFRARISPRRRKCPPPTCAARMRHMTQPTWSTAGRRRPGLPTTMC